MHVEICVVFVDKQMSFSTVYRLFTKFGSGHAFLGSHIYSLTSRNIQGSGLQIRVHIGKLCSLFLIQNICCGYSKEPSQ